MGTKGKVSKRLTSCWLEVYIDAHCLHSQGTQKRSLPVSNATKNEVLGVPISITA